MSQTHFEIHFEIEKRRFYASLLVLLALIISVLFVIAFISEVKSTKELAPLDLLRILFWGVMAYIVLSFLISTVSNLFRKIKDFEEEGLLHEMALKFIWWGSMGFLAGFVLPPLGYLFKSVEGPFFQIWESGILVFLIFCLAAGFVSGVAQGLYKEFKK